jgi:hypothetical protein
LKILCKEQDCPFLPLSALVDDQPFSIDDLSFLAASESSTVSGASSASSSAAATTKSSKANGGKTSEDKENAAAGGEEAPGATGVPPEGEDTMKNLRKAFAGIFGDIN